jgi:hypothetical protein
MSETSRMSGGHPSEDVLELYALGRLEPERLEPVEEHLLICEDCRRAVEQAEEYARIMRAALEAENREEAARSQSRFSFRKGILAATLAVAAGVAFVTLIPREGAPVAEVELTAVRSVAQASAPADRPLVIHADSRGLAGAPFRLEIVDAEGRSVFQGAAEGAGDRVSVRTSKKLPAGQYWVRIYASSGQLLREFGLRTQ